MSAAESTAGPEAEATIGAPETILQLCSGLWLSRALWVACSLRVPDAVDDRPTAVTEIARATGTQPAALARVMRALAAFGVFRAVARDVFTHTPLSATLRSDHPASQRALVDAVFGHEHFDAWGHLETTLRTGRTAFEACLGMPAFDWYGQNPDAAQRFGEAMTSTTRATESAVLSAHHFTPFARAVDLGGNEGSLLRSLLALHPNASGIVFDLPATAERGRAAWRDTPEASRMTALGGNFFESVPEGDLYLLKFILHDWTDEQCAAILRNVRRAIQPDGRVAIVEMVLPGTPHPHPGWLMDLNMLAMTGGRERTLDEYEALLDEAGFTVSRVTPTESAMSVIEAEPKPIAH